MKTSRVANASVIDGAIKMIKGINLSTVNKGIIRRRGGWLLALPGLMLPSLMLPWLIDEGG